MLMYCTSTFGCAASNCFFISSHQALPDSGVTGTKSEDLAILRMILSSALTAVPAKPSPHISAAAATKVVTQRRCIVVVMHSSPIFYVTAHFERPADCFVVLPPYLR